MDVVGLQRLHEVVARATEATSVAGVARVLVEEGVAVLGAAMGGFWLLDGEVLELVHASGAQPPEQFRRISVTSEAPLPAAVRAREALWLSDAADYKRRFPSSLQRVAAQVGCACLPLVVEGRAIGGAVFAFEGSREFTEPERTALVLIARQCAHALDRIRLVDAQHAARHAAEQLALRMTALQALAVQLAAARGFAQTTKTLIDAGRSTLGGAGAMLWLVERDEAVLVAHDGLAKSITDAMTRVGFDDPGPLGGTLRSRTPLWLDSRSSASAQFSVIENRWTGVSAIAIVPLRADDRLVGAYGIAFEQPRTFDVGDREFLELFAVHGAQAIDRMRLVDEAEQLARRMTALQAVAGRLAAARGLPAIVRVVGDEARAAVGAASATVWTHDSVLPEPAADVLRTRTARWERTSAYVPLVADRRLLGVLGLEFHEARASEISEREFIELFAGHVAQALSRDLDDAAERVLAEASSALASSLNVEGVLQQVGELTVGAFAEWCFVDLMRPGEWLERVVTAHADSADAGLAARLRNGHSPVTDAPIRAVSEQQPVLIEAIEDEMLQCVARSPEHLETARAMRLRSLLSVPMNVGGRTVGSISWASRRRALDGRDVRFAAQLARAAAAALENARLYHAVAAGAQRVGKLYELAAALSSARTPGEVATATTRLGCDATGAAGGMIWLRDGDGVLRMLGASTLDAWHAEWAVLPRDPALAANRVIETGEPVWVETPLEFERHAASVFPRAQQEGRIAPFVALPLVIAGERAGVMAFSFRDSHRLEPDERTLLQAIARSCEQALERAQLYATEAAARAAAESASRAKDEFLAMLGHELRNPLAPIVTALDLMRMRSIAEGLRERGVIERQVAHLTRLVDDLLDISRITRGKIELRRTKDELIRAVEPALDAVGPLLLQHRHQLSVDVPATGLRVDGDPARLSQIVRNLITNAAKFTPPGGHLRISARADGDFVELTIADDGRGIPAELLPRVFEPFVQGLQGSERSGGGLGLGLAIVKNLVELHGGTVAIASDGVGQGAEVTVRLPRDSGGEASPRAPEQATTSPRSLRVLVVDDNADAAALLADLLRCLGHDPVVAHDGPTALAAALRDQPQLAILDIGLPGMDGFELARRLRARPELAAVPVVALTGYGQASDRDRTREAGFVEHLVKPVDLPTLQQVVGRFMLS